jgi:hypothetical protein
MAKKIEPALKLISEYLKIEKMENFIIPEYQRSYSWNIPECDKLWQDIETFVDINAIGSGARDPYFFGTIIVDCSKDNEFRLVDGQQRTTTFLLLLKALLLNLDKAIDNIPNDEDSAGLKAGLNANRNKIMSILYKAEAEDIPAILKDFLKVKNFLVLENKSINEIFKDEVKIIVGAKSFDAAEKKVNRIPRKQKDNKYTNQFRNFKYFYTKLSEKSESKLNEFAKVFLNECQIIEIRSWQIEQAITMFNSLNSKGMPLSDADIISAQLYTKAGDDESEYKEQWERINKIASELKSQKIVDINSILMQFMHIDRALNGVYDVNVPAVRRYYTEKEYRKVLLEKPLELCNRLLKILEVWEKISNYPIIKLLLKFNENVKLHLATYMYRYNKDDITEKKVLDICECLLRLFTILELVDVGYSSKNFKMFLFELNTKLIDKSVSVRDIKQIFVEHINNNWKKVEIKDLVSEYDKNILVYLNEYLYTKSKKDAKFDFKENVNIEHIMPDSGRNIISIQQDAGIDSIEEFNDIVNMLGNKILLEENINKSISNEWFKTKIQSSITKKTGYKDSKYNIALALTKYPKITWDKNDIETATEKSAERIVKFIFQC